MSRPAVCRNCGFAIEESDALCPHCGVVEPVLTVTEERRKTRFGVGECVFAILVLIGLLLGLAWLGYELYRWLPGALRKFLR